MSETLHYLVNMLLYVMFDLEERPKHWEDIAKGMFFIINGQHSIGASLKMQTSGLPQKIIEQFLQWNCFIVWSKDKNRLRQILGYYN
jgi:hypothetical protein